MSDLEKRERIKNFFLLQFTVFILAVGFAINKVASNILNVNGYINIRFVIVFSIYLGLTALYAVLWQYSLEKFKLSFLYTNRSFYMIWAQLIAYIFFREKIYWQNVFALGLIVLGVWVNSKDD